MKYSRLLIVLACASSGVFAEQGFYAQIGGGATIPGRNSSTTYSSSANVYSPTAVGTSFFILPNVNFNNKYRNGYNLNTAVGYNFNNRWRADVEFLYQRFKRKISGSYGWREYNASTTALYASTDGSQLNNTSSFMNVYALMTNGYYGFSINPRWKPLVGAGFGIAWIKSAATVSSNVIVVDDPNTPLRETAPTIESTPALYGTAFAWQFKAGIAYMLNDKLDCILQYRLFGTSTIMSDIASIMTNPGLAGGQRTFFIQRLKVRGLLTNSIEAVIKFKIA